VLAVPAYHLVDTASTTASARSTAPGFSSPSIVASTPRLASSASYSLAFPTARSASREPISTSWPVSKAHRRASPSPMSPVPPQIAIRIRGRRLSGD